MNVSRPGPVYTNSDTFQWWIQGRGPPPLFFLRPEGPEKFFFLILLPPSPPPPPLPLSEGLDSPLLLKPQVFFTRFRVDGAFNLHGERSHKDAVSVCCFPFVRVGGKSIRETKNE